MEILINTTAGVKTGSTYIVKVKNLCTVVEYIGLFGGSKKFGISNKFYNDFSECKILMNEKCISIYKNKDPLQLMDTFALKDITFLNDE